MTEPKAKLWCEQFLNDSAGAVACKSIPKTNTKRAVEICVLDIIVFVFLIILHSFFTFESEGIWQLTYI